MKKHSSERPPYGEASMLCREPVRSKMLLARGYVIVASVKLLASSSFCADVIDRVKETGGDTGAGWAAKHVSVMVAFMREEGTYNHNVRLLPRKHRDARATIVDAALDGHSGVRYPLLCVHVMILNQWQKLVTRA